MEFTGDEEELVRVIQNIHEKDEFIIDGLEEASRWVKEMLEQKRAETALESFLTEFGQMIEPIRTFFSNRKDDSQQLYRLGLLVLGGPWSITKSIHQVVHHMMTIICDPIHRNNPQKVQELTLADRELLKSFIPVINIMPQLPYDGETPFAPLEKVERSNPNDIAEIKTVKLYRFGAQYDLPLTMLILVMDLAYAASMDTVQYQGIIHNIAFSSAMMKHGLNPSRAAIKANELRSNPDLATLRKVWNMMEDPYVNTLLTAAATVGFLPSRAFVEQEITMPVPSFSTPLVGKFFSDNMRSCLFASTTVWGRWFGKPRPTQFIVEPISSINADTIHPLTPALKLLPSTKLSQSLSSVLPPANQNSEPSPKAINLEAEDLANVIILHFHGGGFVSHTPDSHAIYLREWAHDTGIPILSLSYGLAPEYRYPHALNQAFAEYLWVLNNPAALGLEGNPRIILVGDSAGGTLATALTLKLVEEKVKLPHGILLAYPALNLDRSVSLSRSMFLNDPVLCFPTMELSVNSYVPPEKRSETGSDFLMSPLCAPLDLLQQFPPCHIFIGDIDPMLDDAVAFTARLLKAGRKVVLKVVSSLSHAWINCGPNIPKAEIAIQDIAYHLARLVRGL